MTCLLLVMCNINIGFESAMSTKRSRESVYESMQGLDGWVPKSTKMSNSTNGQDITRVAHFLRYK